MADTMTPEQRSRCMAKIHSSNTKPELVLRHALWRKGYRYRINDRRLPGTPDIVLPRYRTVIFIHGCFWHGHQGCRMQNLPKSNTDFWAAKIARNKERDQVVWRELEAKGWAVIIVWECQLKKSFITDTVELVNMQIQENGRKLQCRKDERRRARTEYLEERRKHKAIEASFKAERHR